MMGFLGPVLLGLSFAYVTPAQIAMTAAFDGECHEMNMGGLRLNCSGPLVNMVLANNRFAFLVTASSPRSSGQITFSGQGIKQLRNGIWIAPIDTVRSYSPGNYDNPTSAPVKGSCKITFKGKARNFSCTAKSYDGITFKFLFSGNGTVKNLTQ